MSAYLDWKIGDRVVCIDDHVHNYAPGFFMIRRGTLYTIRRFEACQIRNVIGINLHEMRLPMFSDDVEYGWLVRRFRKVETRKTDISCFEAILNGARIPENA
jgi:hypothetical protein